MRAERPLIITCEQCDTRFQLDPSKVPAQGARVRCSRCKHVFQVESPNASFDEALEDIAFEAARDPGAAPDVAQDPGPAATAASGARDEDEGDPFADTMQGVGFDVSVAGAPRPTGEAWSPDESAPDDTSGQTLGAAEEDWEFNDDPPTEVVDTTATGSEEEEAPPILQDRRQAMPEASQAQKAPHAPQAPRSPDSPVAADDDFDLGGLDDLGSDEEDEEAGSDAGTTDEDLFGGLDDLIGEDATEEPAAVAATAAIAAGRQDAPRQDEQGLGDFRSAADDLLTDGRAPELGDFLNAAPQDDHGEAAAAATAVPEPSQATSQASEPARPRRRRLTLRWSERWTMMAGSTVVGMLLLAAVLSVAADTMREPVTEPFAPGLVGPGVQVDALGSRLIDNVHSGPLLVVSGQLGQSLPRGSQALRVVLLDADGSRLQEAWAGPALGERWIRESAPADIASELQTRSGQFAFMGGRIQAVFPAPPAAAADFLVELAARPIAAVTDPEAVAGPAQAADAGD